MTLLEQKAEARQLSAAAAGRTAAGGWGCEGEAAAVALSGGAVVAPRFQQQLALYATEYRTRFATFFSQVRLAQTACACRRAAPALRPCDTAGGRLAAGDTARIPRPRLPLLSSRLQPVLRVVTCGARQERGRIEPCVPKRRKPRPSSP